MDLMRDQNLEEFLISLQRFIARRRRPEKVYSDNFSTFVASSKWLKGILQEEKIHDFLAKHHIKWQFNLSGAPWWGSQFERINVLTKQTLFKAIGKTKLTWKELESVLLDIEMDKGVSERPGGATQPGTQFQGIEIKRRCSDHTRRREKQSTLGNWDCPSAFTWEWRYH